MCLAPEFGPWVWPLGLASELYAMISAALMRPVTPAAWGIFSIFSHQLLKNKGCMGEFFDFQPSAAEEQWMHGGVFRFSAISCWRARDAWGSSGNNRQISPLKLLLASISWDVLLNFSLIIPLFRTLKLLNWG